MMKKRFGIIIALVTLILSVFGISFISALTPSLCKDKDGYYNDCGMVHGYPKYYSDIGYYSDYGHYDYGKLTSCRNERGEYYYCYKEYNDYDYNYDNRDYYDDYYYYSGRDYSQQYNDKYGNLIRITRTGYNREYCYWVNDGWWRDSRKVCYNTNSYDYQNDPYYPDYYMQMNTNNKNMMNDMIYVR